MPEVKTLGSRQVYENRWIRVREDRILFANGLEGIYGVIEKNNSSLIFPLTEDGFVYLVEQWRYPVGRRYWELPQGSWESDPSVDPLILAQGELREETGLTACEMDYVGELFESYGLSNNRCHIFLAKGLTEGKANIESEEQGLICQKFALNDAIKMVINGEIQDAVTVAAFGLLRLKNLI